MALVKCPTVNIDCSSPEYKNRMSPNKIADLFKQTGPKLSKLVLKNAEDCIFPVESVDAYLREHPENVINVTHLALCFDPRNSVQLLEMVANRFPKIERLSINYSDDHPIEHTLTQLARIPNLVETMLPCGFKELYDFLSARPFAPFTNVKFLYSGHCDGSDSYEHFQATVPVISQFGRAAHCLSQ